MNDRYLDLPPERDIVGLRLLLLRFGLRLLLRLGFLQLRLVAVLDLLDDPVAETIVAGAADVGGRFEEHEYHGGGCVLCFGLDDAW